MTDKCSSRAEQRLFCVCVWFIIKKYEHSERNGKKSLMNDQSRTSKTGDHGLFSKSDTLRPYDFWLWTWEMITSDPNSLDSSSVVYSFILYICNCGLYSCFWHHANQFSPLPSALKLLSHSLFFLLLRSHSKIRKSLIISLPNRTHN